MNYWIFQGNPDQFNIDDYLNKTRSVYWSVTIPRYQNEIDIGDVVYLWRAQGKQKAISGIIARGRIREKCKPREELDFPIHLYDELWIRDSKEKSQIKAGIILDEVRLTPKNGMIKNNDFLADTILRKSQIIKTRVGSNFKLSQEEFSRIEQLWYDSLISIEEEYIVSEGKILQRIHRFRERDPKLKSLFISQYKDKFGTLSCQLCGIQPKDVYKSLGEHLLEVHHTIPLVQLEQDQQTKLEDLMLLCPNCHRAVHSGDAVKNLDTLRNLFQQNATANG